MARLRVSCNVCGVTLAQYLFAPDVPDDPTAWRKERRSGAALGAAASSDAAALDRSLIERIIAGDEDAFRAVYLEHYSALHAVARGIVKSSDVADDVVQQVFVEIWSRRAQWNPVQLRPSLIRSVRYRALDQLRRVRGNVELHSSLPASGVTGIDEEYQDLAQRLSRAINALPERRRTALLLRAVHELSYADIGAALEVSEKAAFVLVARARASLEPLRRLFVSESGER
jgi:RNA polymerase sigma-70 factor (ECF subfamily)